MNEETLQALKTLKKELNEKAAHINEPGPVTFGVADVDNTPKQIPVALDEESFSFTVNPKEVQAHQAIPHIEENRVEITVANIESVLGYWELMTHDPNQHRKNAYFLLRHLPTLPMPGIKKNCPWKGIKNIDETLDLLSVLARRLTADQIDPDLRPAMRTKTILYSHALLGMMEHLALQDPKSKMTSVRIPKEGISNYLNRQLDPDETDYEAANLRISYNLLQQWSSSGACVLEDPEDAAYLEKLLLYASYEENPVCSLFDYRYMRNRIPSGNTTPISPAERLYLNELQPLCQSEEFAEICLPLGELAEETQIESDPDSLEAVSSHRYKLAKAWKVAVAQKPRKEFEKILLQMTFATEDAESIVPRSYRQLKRQAYNAANMILISRERYKYSPENPRNHAEFNPRWRAFEKWWNAKPRFFTIPEIKLPSPSTRNFVFTRHGATFEFLQPVVNEINSVLNDSTQTIRSWSPFSSIEVLLPAPQPKPEYREHIIPKLNGIYNSPVTIPIDERRYSQSEIIFSSTKPVPIPFVQVDTDKEKIQSCMIYTHGKDQILRLIAYINRDQKTLAFLSNHLLIHDTLLHGQQLFHLLIDSPESMKALAEFVETAFASKENNYPERTLLLAVCLKRYCARLTPQYLPLFDSLKTHIERSKSLLITELRPVLRALADGPINIHWSPEKIDQAIEDCCVALFIQPRWLNKQHLLKHTFEDLSHQMKWLFIQNRGLIEHKLASNPELCNRVGARICSYLNVEKSAREQQWIFKNDQKYGGAFYLNSKGTDILIPAATHTGAFTEDPTQLAPSCIPHIQNIDSSSYEQLGITLETRRKNKNEWLLACRRNINGIPCIAYNCDTEEGTLLKAIYENGNEEHGSIYIEEAAGDRRAVFVQNAKTLKTRKIGTLERDVQGNTLFQPAIDPDKLIPVSIASCRGLSRLDRFVNPDAIEAYRREGEDRLALFKITPYDLEFEVKTADKQTRAYNTNRYPDYFIASSQNEPSVRNFGAYLLLENRVGAKKVMIPDGQWLASAAWNALSHTAPVAHLAAPMLRENARASAKKAYVYDLDASGRLTSEEPEALLYLLSLYLLQGNSKAARDTCNQIEAISKLKEISKQAVEKLLPLAMIANMGEEAKIIRLRLLAAIEQNRTTPFTEECLQSEQKCSTFESLIYIQAIISDLNALLEMSPYKKQLYTGGGLTEEKEWFLFKALIRHGIGLLSQSDSLSPKGASMAERLGWENIIEAVALPPALSARYRSLKQKYGIEDSLAIRALRAAAHYHRTESSIPSHFLNPLYWTGRLNQFVNQANTLLEQNSASKSQSFVNDLKSLFPVEAEMKKIGKIALTHLKRYQVDPLELRRKMRFDTEANPPLDASRMSAEDIVHNFLSYYAIARGERTAQEKAQLTRSLSLFQGSFSLETEQLTSILRAVLKHPLIYPSATSIKEAFLKEAPLPDLLPEEVDEAIFTFVDDPIQLNAQGSFQSLRSSFLRIYTAIMNGEPEVLWHIPKLKSITTAAKGPNAKLAQFLLKVKQHPERFLPPQEFASLLRRLEKELKKSNFTKSSLLDHNTQWSPCLSSWKKIMIAYRGSTAAIEGGSTLMKLYAQSKISVGPQAPILPVLFGGWSFPATATLQMVIPAASKLYNALRTKQKSEPLPLKAPEREPNNPTLYRALDEIDNRYDSLLDHLFRLAFKKKAVDKSADPLFHPFNTDNLDSVNKARFERVNRDIDAFGKRTTAADPHYILNSSESLFELYTTLKEAIQGAEDALAAEQNQILALINPNEIQLDQAAVPFRAILRLFLKGDYQALGQQTSFTSKEIQKLDHVIARHLAASSRLLQLKRTAAHIEGLAAIDPKSQTEKYRSQVESIANELLARRAYSFGSSQDKERCIASPRLLRRFLLFEALQNKMIWPKQFERIKNLLLSADRDICLELIMGMGKTFFGIPTINSFAADGKMLVVNIWPSEMAATNTRQNSRQGRETFDQVGHGLAISRSIPTTPSILDSISILFQSAAEDGNTINMTRESAQGLELMFLETLYNVAAKNSDRDKAALGRLKKILSQLRFDGGSRAVGDEGHVLFNCSVEQNWPVGSDQTITKEDFKTVERVLRLLADEIKVMKAIRANRINELPQNEREKALRNIAARLSSKPEIQDYLLGKSASVPETVKRSKNRRALSLAKGVIASMLPKVFDEDILVDQGPSETHASEVYSRPYGGNMSPDEDSLFRLPYIALVRTFIRYYHTGLTSKEAKALVTSLVEKAKNQAKKMKSKNHRETPAWRELLHICKGSEVDQRYSAQDPQLIAFLLHNTRAINAYIGEFVCEKILYWKENLTANPQNFASMFASQYHDTGTPYNDGSYPGSVKMLWDPGTTGEALETLSRKCPAGGIRILDSAKPADILDEVLQVYFKSGSDFTSLIDGSAQLKGLSNEAVADRMLAYIGEHRPDLKGVAYFQKDKNGKDLLVIKELGAKEAVPIDQSSIKPEERLSYYDQRHGFAADIPQKSNARGLDLIGPKVTLFRLLQEVYRMRGLKTWKRLVGIGSDKFDNDDSQTQQIHFAMTKSTAFMIGDKETPDLRDIVRFAIKNEAKQAALDNYNSYKQKVLDVPRRYVIDLILKASSANEMVRFFNKYRDLLVQKVEDDPTTLFGMIDTELSLETAIASLKKAALAPFKGQDRQIVSERIEAIPKHPMPPQIPGQTDGSGKAVADSVDLDASVTVQARQKQEAHQENEQENEVENEEENENTVQDNMDSGYSYYTEIKWPEEITPWNRENWLIMQQPGSWSFGGNKVPPLFAVSDLLKASGSDELQKIGGAFDKRLWFSNNVLPVRNGLFSRSAKIGSRQQRPIHHLLVTGRKTEAGYCIESVGAISHEEKVQWEKKLQSIPRNPDIDDDHTKFACIYDAENRIILHKTTEKDPKYKFNVEDPIDSVDLEADRGFLTMLVQLKFLNGDTKYTKTEIDLLKGWLQTQEAHLMESGFKKIFKHQGDTLYYNGSPIQLLFGDLMEL